MTEKRIKNLGASVRARLLNLSHARQEPFDLILVRYALERLLYRLGASKWRSRFAIKGAMLFPLWHLAPQRPTRDLDLLGFSPLNVSQAEEYFASLCALEVVDDGLRFLADSVRGEEIRETSLHQGVRIRMIAVLAGATIPLQIDIGFDDVVTPPAEMVSYPVMLEGPAPIVLAYSKPAMIAEKAHAIVVLGMTNSRMKDFYDLYALASHEPFDGDVISQALAATFARRGTPIPADVPIALTGAFGSDASNQMQWLAFLNRSRFVPTAPELSTIVQLVQDFLWPALQAARGSRRFSASWPEGGPWQLM